MSLAARLRGLEARVEWLQDWGELRKLAQKVRFLKAKEKIIEQAPELAVRFGLMPPPPKPVPPPALPPPPKQESRHREEPRPSDVLETNSARRLDSHEVIPAPGCATETSQGGGPSAPRDASLHDAPRGEVVPRPPPRASPPPEQPAVPFVPIQSGLIRWQQHGPEDDREDDEPLEGEDYDPFSDES